VTSLVDCQNFRAAKQGLPPEQNVSTSDPSRTSFEALQEDAGHRDVTFNSFYYDPSTHEVVDPTGRGLKDLEAGVIRMPHPRSAAESIADDPLRVLRCYRFAARFGFDLDEALSLEPSDKNWAKGVSPGRLLNEVKKALLLHNRPSRFLALLDGPGEVHQTLFSKAGAQTLDHWQAGVGRVNRLETIVLEGLRRGHITSRSIQWRGRPAGSSKAAFLSPDWRKKGMYENDWAELVLAALLWSCDAKALKGVGSQLELGGAMVETIGKLQEGARKKSISPQTAPPGVHLLNAAAASSESAESFWSRWPPPPPPRAPPPPPSGG